MKTYIIITLAIAALAAGFTCHAQTNGAASINAAGVSLTPDQLAQLNNGIDSLVPLIPASYQAVCIKILGWLGFAAVIGRFLKGWIVTGSIPGGVWHLISGIFFNHTPNPPDPNAGTQGAGASKLRGVGLMLCLGIAALATGCTVLDTPQGKILSVTSRGLYVDVAATSNTTGTPEIKLGLGSQTVTLVPTSTNASGTITSPNVSDSSLVNQTVNPFSTSGSESFASGNYQVNQTNDASATQPIVPK